jgi:hypothetical protein
MIIDSDILKLFLLVVIILACIIGDIIFCFWIFKLHDRIMNYTLGKTQDLSRNTPK